MRRVRARLSSRGRITVPRSVRERLRLEPGDSIEFEERNGDVVVRRSTLAVAFDPFATFVEWASDADEEAYADPWRPAP